MTEFEKELTKKIDKLIEDVNNLKIKNTELEKSISELSVNNNGDGIYLDGCPDYTKEYIEKSKKKVGE